MTQFGGGENEDLRSVYCRGIIKGAKKFLWLSYFNQVRFDLNVTKTFDDMM